MIHRRKFIKNVSAGVAGLAVSGFSPTSKNIFSEGGFPYLKNTKISQKVIAIGIDGMDPKILKRFIAEGDMPTFEKVMANGHFGELATTMPPHTPVAWASFISGTNPGGHGIFDFIHRDPKTFTPHLSTSRIIPGKKQLDLGNWSIPLDSGKAELMRKGPAFWNYLEAQDIPAVLFQLPSNFPVTESTSKAMSGMGTPDLLGSYGTFTFVSEVPVSGSEKFTGGKVIRVTPTNHKVVVRISGPSNPFTKDHHQSEVEIIIYRDPLEKVVKLEIDGQILVLQQGEWSGWLPVRFRLIPLLASVAGMLRVYVKEVHPHLQIYISPLNIDPMEPSLPISSPPEYSREVANAIGRFHTQGFPTDTKSLSHGILSDDEYLQLGKLILNESLNAFEYEFDKFHEGFFFFYFSSIDQNSHMLWRTMDSTHPLYDSKASREVKDGVRYYYKRMDEVLRKALTKVDSSTTLMLLSDHGFAPFTREFHLSTWLYENGFTSITHPERLSEGQFYQYVNWEKTKAYALGINGIYLNLENREEHGTLPQKAIKRVKNEIVAKLLEVVDPKTGEKVVSHVYDAKEIYKGPYCDLSPDLVVGYASGYRISDEAVLGEFPKGILSDRTNKWSADHCIDFPIVPGMLLSNKAWGIASPGIWDMAPTILKAFGIETPKEMEGKPVFKS